MDCRGRLRGLRIGDGVAPCLGRVGAELGPSLLPAQAVDKKIQLHTPNSTTLTDSQSWGLYTSKAELRMQRKLLGTKPDQDARIALPNGYRRTVRWLPQIGDVVPDFEAESTQGRIRFHDWAEGSWVVLGSHPAAFTSICTTEVADLANWAEDFRARNAQVINLSRTGVAENREWVAQIESMFGVPVEFPLVTDPDGTLLRSFGMLHEKENARFCIRKSFIIDPALRVRAILEYPMRVGRNVEELVRILDALRLSDSEEVGIPSGWSSGDPILVPDGMTDAEACNQFAGRVTFIRPYLRVVAPRLQ